MHRMEQKIIVAIDGYSSSGKSTMAKALARTVGYHYVDSGAMYRAVTLFALRHGMIAPDGAVDCAALEAGLPEINITFTTDTDGAQVTELNGEDVEHEIRGLGVADHVSAVAAIGAVRERLTALQREMGERKGIVMDGRDIGTTVFPQAEMKVFVEASPEVRARRRWLELTGKGQNASYQEVLDNVRERDRIDTTRAISPLRKAADALELDNDNLTMEEQMEWLLQKFQEITGGKN